jgi:hypothetical protein
MEKNAIRAENRARLMPRRGDTIHVSGDPLAKLEYPQGSIRHPLNTRRKGLVERLTKIAEKFS